MHLSFFRSILVGGPVSGDLVAAGEAANDVRGWRGLLLVAGVIAGITLVAALLVLPVGFLVGTDPYWLAPQRDQAQHLAGAAFYVRSAWTWPPFFVPELDFPEGTSVVFTDSIPLLALPAKALYALTGFYHPYFGPYLLLCYLLQGPAFALLLHALGVRDRVCLVLGGLLAVLSPVLLARYMHVALCSQFLLLLALAVHFRATRAEDGGGGPRPYLLAHTLLALAGLLIHPYLGLMLLIVFGMTVLQRLWRGGLTVAGAWARVGAVAVALVATMLAAGHLGSVDLPPRPYGEGGLNLLSIVPQRSGLVPGLSGYLVGHFEEMTWVGAGGLLLVGCALWLVRRREGARGVLARRLPEVLVCFATTLFALTYAVHLGPHLVMGVPPEKVRGVVIAAMQGGGLRDALAAFDGADLARLGLLAAVVGGGLGAAVWFALRERRYRFVAFLASGAVVGAVALVLFPKKTLTLLTNFQASPRFFWVVLYLALAAATAVVARRLPRHAARLVLAAALALQLVDVRPSVDDLRREALAPPGPVVPDEDALAPAFARASAVVLVPDYLCAVMAVGSEEGQRLQVLYDGLHFLASRTATPINSMRHARMSALFPTGAQAASCAETEERARRRAFGPDTAYFFVEPGRLGSASAAPPPEGCRALRRGLLCE